TITFPSQLWLRCLANLAEVETIGGDEILPSLALKRISFLYNQSLSFLKRIQYLCYGNHRPLPLTSRFIHVKFKFFKVMYTFLSFLDEISWLPRIKPKDSSIQKTLESVGEKFWKISSEFWTLSVSSLELSLTSRRIFRFHHCMALCLAHLCVFLYHRLPLPPPECIPSSPLSFASLLCSSLSMSTLHKTSTWPSTLDLRPLWFSISSTLQGVRTQAPSSPSMSPCISNVPLKWIFFSTFDAALPPRCPRLPYLYKTLAPLLSLTISSCETKQPCKREIPSSKKMLSPRLSSLPNTPPPTVSLQLAFPEAFIEACKSLVQTTLRLPWPIPPRVLNTTPLPWIAMEATLLNSLGLRQRSGIIPTLEYTGILNNASAITQTAWKYARLCLIVWKTEPTAIEEEFIFEENLGLENKTSHICYFQRDIRIEASYFRFTHALSISLEILQYLRIYSLPLNHKREPLGVLSQTRLVGDTTQKE
ncbi:hypothetical protein IE077_000058, partial [Cardiosporidium cionae]